MKHRMSKTAVIAAAVITSGTAFAHSGTHGAEGLMAGFIHMLAEHAYLTAVVLCVIWAIVLRVHSMSDHVQ